MPGVAMAQPVVAIPPTAVARPVPLAPGTGSQALFVRTVFSGMPRTLDEARALIDGTSLAPAFDLWCGLLPYVDFGNGATRDSRGREDPTLLCLPFIDPARSVSLARCRALPELPTGMYSTNGGAAMRIEGWLAVRTAGVFTFAWGHDDGMAFTLGGLTVFAYTDSTAPRIDRRAVSFSQPGLYPFTLEWFDGIGGALIDWYRAPGDLTATDAGTLDDRFELVPREDLYPSGALPCTARCERCTADRAVCDFYSSRCVECLDDSQCSPCSHCTAGVCTHDSPLVCTDSGTSPVDAAINTDEHHLDGAMPPTARSTLPEGCACQATTPATPRLLHFLWVLSTLLPLIARRRRRSPRASTR